MRTTWFASVLLAVAASALPAQSDSVAAPRPPKPSSSLITFEEIERVRGSVANAYDAVQLLRPRWLRTADHPPIKGSGESLRMPQFHVYLDDHEMGDLSFLKSLPAVQVYTLRFLSLAEVGARYGPSSGPGIVVTLKR
ncbi:MAG: hypothetical protein ACM358_13745 [Gemmatimonadota bacterium]